jgi:hypothetical protein
VRYTAVPEMEVGDCGVQKMERGMIRERRCTDEWGWREKEGERGRKKGITGGMEERKGGLDIPIKGGRKGGRPGDRARLGKIQGVPLKVRIRMGKKGGEERWTG